MKKQGFTLVELSIVLVIIGLLVGGILVAQSMISTTRTVKLIKEVKELQIPMQQFKSIYGYLPGDYPYSKDRMDTNDWWNNGTGSGNGNWEGWHTGEGILLWGHLHRAGIYKVNPNQDWPYAMLLDANSTSQWIGQLVPKLSNGGTLVGTFQDWTGNDFSASTSTAFNSCPGKAFLRVSGKTDTALTMSISSQFTNGVMSPADAKALDSKIDDGNAFSGRVLGENSDESSTNCREESATDGWYGRITTPDGDYRLTGDSCTNCCSVHFCADNY